MAPALAARHDCCCTSPLPRRPLTVASNQSPKMALIGPMAAWGAGRAHLAAPLRRVREAHHAEQFAVQRRQHKARSMTCPPPLCPPEVFGIVEQGVYRSNALRPVNFPFIELLRLKTVVYLSPDMPLRSVTSFLKEHGIRLVRAHGTFVARDAVVTKPAGALGAPHVAPVLRLEAHQR